MKNILITKANRKIGNNVKVYLGLFVESYYVRAPESNNGESKSLFGLTECG